MYDETIVYTKFEGEFFLPKTIHRIDSASCRVLDSPSSLTRSVVYSETIVPDAFITSLSFLRFRLDIYFLRNMYLTTIFLFILIVYNEGNLIHAPYQVRIFYLCFKVLNISIQLILSIE